MAKQFMYDEKVCVIVSSLEEELNIVTPEKKKETTRAILRTFGAWSIISTEETKQAILASDLIVDEAKEKLKAERVGASVVLLEEFIEGFTENELLALIGHEVGHIKLGHLTGNHEKVDMILNSVTCELEADGYGVKLTSKKDMASALQKLAANAGKVISHYAAIYGKVLNPKQITDEVLYNPAMVTRFQALR